MTTNINLADLAFLLANVIEGSNPPPGTDPFSLTGTRTVDGTNNNLTHEIIIDQHGNTVDTDTFANVDQPFFHLFGPTPPASNTGYDQDFFSAIGNSIDVTDATPRIISNLIADQSANNPALPASADGNAGDPAFFVAPTNALFTFFGQFFDHGLDFINKGGNGQIHITLDANDPLFAASQFGPTPGEIVVDRATRTNISASNISGDSTNADAPLVEQSQTYGQAATTTFYLMEYDVNGVATGRLVTNADGGMANWADIKANALKKGIILEDRHAIDIPDPALWGSANINEWDPLLNGGQGGFVSPGSSTGQAFLNDLAHTAVPLTGLLPDADFIINPPGPPSATTYDNELLDAHKIAGDGRANENGALTAIHSAFHGEHNRLVLLIEDLVAQQDQITPGSAAQWDGARIFEAAKLINEMQYQHFVFEEFARRMSPNIDAFAQYDVTINPNISAEFAHAVYRLGHSQLNETVAAVNSVDQTQDFTLVEAFLNPVLFDDVGAAALIEGQTRQQSNTIDEFVTDALRNFLVGLPLDLAAINIARGRDLNLPTLNQVRAELFAQTGETTLEAYVSWADFGASLLNPASLINYIAAYADDLAIAAARNGGDLTLARTLAETATQNVVFMSETGDLGFNNIDLWIGGLGEAKALGPAGELSQLGSTFDFIFANQLLALQNGDRLYYLARLGGTNILEDIESSVFGELFERGTGARHTNGDIFGATEETIEISNLIGENFTSIKGNWREVIGGTTADNIINSGDGNDTVWGEAGNDTISTGGGKDHVFGGAGDDIISGGSSLDFLRGDDGNDTIRGDSGDDLLFGNKGNDTIFGGTGFDTLLGHTGNDTLHGGDQDDTLLGLEDNDILFGDLGDDALEGGQGDDYLDGGRGADTLIGDIGDDVLLGGAGGDVLDGGLGGYDIAIYDRPGITSGMTIDVGGLLSTGDAIGDVLIDIEEVRGTRFDDQIFGDPLLGMVISGGGGNDIITGGLGDDTIYSNLLGQDTIDGGGGFDAVVYLGAISTDYNIQINSDGNGTVEHIGSGITDTLAAIRTLAFDDRFFDTLTLKDIPLVGITGDIPANDPTTLIINSIELDGNLVNTVPIFDNTDMSLAGVNGIFIGHIDILDADGVLGIAATTLLGDDAASFQVVNIPGGQDLYFVGGGPLSRVNFEAQNVYHVTVDYADDSGGSAINFTLNITDVNDNATLFTSPDSASVHEGVSTSAVVYRATSTDLDTVGAAPVYTLGGVDAAAFNIVNGEVTFAVSPDFDAPTDTGGDNVYDIDIIATDVTNVDPTKVTVTKSIKIRVNDVNAPVFVALPAIILPVENTDASTIILDADATDPDGDTITFSLSGVDASFFNINSATGEITFAVSPDFENPQSDSGDNNYQINVIAADGTASTTQAVTVGVTNEAGVTILGTTGFDIITSEFIDAASNIPGQPLPTSEEDHIFGDIGVDYLDGGAGNDIIEGGASEDTIIGGAGDDDLHGNSQGDFLFGGIGNDTLHGNDGADLLNGGDGDDLLVGGTEDDTILGGLGVDILHGQEDNDVLEGGADNDILFGGTGDDDLHGNSQDDMLHGGAGNDKLWGNEGVDILFGEADNDMLVGGLGDDIIRGGTGIDTLFGEQGNDTFIIAIGDEADTIGDFEFGAGLTDRVDVSAFGFADHVALFAAITDVGTDAVLDLGGLDSLTFTGVLKTDFVNDDFVII